ncbi:MAG: ABC transporter substrate-binding protein [Paracoccaceae bacterium]
MALRPFLIAALAALLSLNMAPHGYAGDKTQEAVRTAEHLLSDAHAALGASNRPALRAAINTAFAFDVWERFLIQNRQDAFAPAERQEFRGLLPGFLAHLYQDQFQRGLSAAPTLGEARAVRRDVLVSSQFPRSNGGELPVEWRIREFPGRGSQVIDVMVAGTSFLLLKRDEFTAIIDQGGAEALLVHMRERSF